MKEITKRAYGVLERWAAEHSVSIQSAAEIIGLNRKRPGEWKSGRAYVNPIELAILVNHGADANYILNGGVVPYDEDAWIMFDEDLPMEDSKTPWISMEVELLLQNGHHIHGMVEELTTGGARCYSAEGNMKEVKAVAWRSL